MSAGSVAKELEQTSTERVYGPGPVPVILSINGEKRIFQLEPRVTLLEALRHQAGLTGAKEPCDRATCGACTVLLDDVPVYACSMLAIEAQGAEITTIEGIAKDGRLTKLQQAFVQKDGLQCGYCTPGMVMTLTALLRRNPHPTEAEVRKACSGNLCRCGSYPRIFAAALDDRRARRPPPKLEVIHFARPCRGLRKASISGSRPRASTAPPRRPAAPSTPRTSPRPACSTAPSSDRNGPRPAFARSIWIKPRRHPGIKAAIRVHEGEHQVRFYGEELAALAGVSRQAVLDALRLIEVEATPLPFTVNELDAIQPDAPRVVAERPNLGPAESQATGDVDAAFAAAAAVVEGTFTTQVEIHHPLEPHGGHCRPRRATNTPRGVPPRASSRRATISRRVSACRKTRCACSASTWAAASAPRSRTGPTASSAPGWRRPPASP